METLYDHIFSEDGPRGVYLQRYGRRYSIHNYSIDNNRMTVDYGNSREEVPILPHLHDRHVVGLSFGDLEILVKAKKEKK